MNILNYATLAQVKSYLGVSWTSEDTVIQQLLNSSYYTLNKLLSITSFNETTSTEQVDIREIYRDAWYYWYNIFLKNKPVTAITKINDTAYTGVKGTDYMIVYDRKAIISDMNDYVLNLDFNYFNIEYTRWYDRDETLLVPWTWDTLPDDIKLLQMMLVSGLYNTKGMEWLKQYKLGDETITFWSVSWKAADDTYFSFKTILDKYKTFILP